eukprot:CAMPEP_0118683634 /NCGR_PEP_ID=MMETSP0800-20121206/6164_1 /TAXON_ID=210618 ORGANISM="Striatella unipunctata, Strain CCMP2910" /NCGR_SAMPLE_ID=MMETSP0800 /ASSEMBLY_ACC=CAM_ASM_000638 /LENGTH=97 /DNA_ID=CAMNT_0006580185 /DNA_START=34 /DNA_END=327 /DNA_ORIENTATION=-
MSNDVSPFPDEGFVVNEADTDLRAQVLFRDEDEISQRPFHHESYSDIPLSEQSLSEQSMPHLLSDRSVPQLSSSFRFANASDSYIMNPKHYSRSYSA